MSFGRWLLIHSFSIFLVTVFILAYIYRTELQLEQVYNQVLNTDSKSTPGVSRVDNRPAQKEVQEDATVSSKIPVAASRSSVTMSLPSPPPPPQETVKPAKKPVPPVTVLPSPPETEENSVGLQDELFLARQAYWDKNYTEAIDRYQKLIQEDRNNPDYRGELGNIYYALNDYANASQLYYQSGLILIQQNRPEQARMLVSPVIAMNRELGEKLKSKLREN